MNGTKDPRRPVCERLVVHNRRPSARVPTILVRVYGKVEEGCKKILAGDQDVEYKCDVTGEEAKLGWWRWKKRGGREGEGGYGGPEDK